MNNPPVQKIVVCGSGLAGYMCVAALAHTLPDNIDLTLVETSDLHDTDIFYGSVTSPSSYTFLLGLGITEPNLLPVTTTTFSLGTRYENWGPDARNWTQSFHHPLPLFNGVGFHHYLTRLRASAPELTDFESYIMSVQAADKGAFAHPPEARKTPLADMDFGYHFMPEDWRTFFSKRIDAGRVTRVTSGIEAVSRDENTIKSISLTNGETLEADLFIDALGPQSQLTSQDAGLWTGQRRIKAAASYQTKDKLEGVCRVLTGANYGWQSDTPLRGGVQRLTVFDPASEDAALQAHGDSISKTVALTLGHSDSPWTGNCLVLGHGAAALEPVSPAPMMLLQRDIERLIELVPITTNMTVEKREYNRRFNADYEHAQSFQRAFFERSDETGATYWSAATSEPVCDKLSSKIRQFESRGVFVQYDYEPFDTQDWAMLHFGMGRAPSRYDPLADKVSEAQLKAKLTQMRSAIEIMRDKLPPHGLYMSKLLRYLKDQNG